MILLSFDTEEFDVPREHDVDFPLDEAMKVLPPFMQKDQSRWTYHSLESAATLKAQVLLYAASPLFNGNPAYTNFKNKKGERRFLCYNSNNGHGRKGSICGRRIILRHTLTAMTRS